MHPPHSLHPNHFGSPSFGLYFSWHCNGLRSHLCFRDFLLSVGDAKAVHRRLVKGNEKLLKEAVKPNTGSVWFNIRIIRDANDEEESIQIESEGEKPDGLACSYTLKSGCSKTLRSNKIYRSYSNKGEGSFFYDGCCEPYVWIHNPSHAAKYFISPMAAKQQYISLDDLREWLEMKIYMEGGNGNFSVLKMPRSC